MATKKRTSPLKGLVEYVIKMTPEEQKEVFRQPTSEEKRAQDSVRRIHALVALIKESPSWHGGLRTYPWHVDKEFDWVDFGERKPYETFAVARDGRVVRHTCEYSGHNGDSYDDQYVYLEKEAAQKALAGLVNRLEGLALAAEERRLEEAARRRKAMAAKLSLNARLRSKGLL